MLGRPECLGDYGWIHQLVLFGKGKAVAEFTERRIACDPFDPSAYAISTSVHISQENFTAARAAIAKGRELFGPRPPYAEGEFLLAVSERNFTEAKRLLPGLGNDRRLQLLLANQEGSPEAAQLQQQAKTLLMTLELTDRFRTQLLLQLAAQSGDRAEASRLAGELDSSPFGASALMDTAMNCMCGSPFPLEATPNFAKQLESAGLEWTPSSLPWPNKDW